MSQEIYNLFFFFSFVFGGGSILNFIVVGLIYSLTEFTLTVKYEFFFLSSSLVFSSWFGWDKKNLDIVLLMVFNQNHLSEHETNILRNPLKHYSQHRIYGLKLLVYKHEYLRKMQFTMALYSAIKNSKILSFEGKWIQPQLSSHVNQISFKKRTITHFRPFVYPWLYRRQNIMCEHMT